MKSKLHIFLLVVAIFLLGAVCINGSSNKPDEYFSIPLKVLHVVDGDTIILEIKKKEQKNHQ